MQAILHELKGEWLSDRRGRFVKRPTDDLEAYRVYLKGRSFWHRRYEGFLQKAMECFQQAIQKDPNFVLGYTGLADTYNSLGVWGWAPPGEVFPKAATLVQKALEIDDELAEAHATQAFVDMFYDWDWASQHFLRRNIKYQAVTSMSAYQSKPATKTLADQYGVCRDVAVLMCSMLRASRIRSFPAATGYNRVLDHEIPHDIFQHMIVAVPDRGGAYRLYDPTSVLYAEDRLPGYAGIAPLLVCTPGGENLTRIPHIPAHRNAGSVQARSRIDSDGILSSTITISGKGFYDEDLRNWRKRTKQEDYQRRWREIVAQLHSSARLTSLSTSDPEDLRTPFKVSLSYEVPDYATPAPGGIALKVPVATDVFERVVVDIIARANRPERRLPFIVTSAAGVQAWESITLLAGCVVKSLPEPVSMRTKDLTLAVSYAVAGTGGGAVSPAIEFSKTFLLDSRQFDPAAYLELRKVRPTRARGKLKSYSRFLGAGSR